MAVRVAVTSFLADMLEDGLGEDEHGQKMAKLYSESLKEVLSIISLKTNRGADMKDKGYIYLQGAFAELQAMAHDTGIVTENIRPPIPTAKLDWCAWIDGDEEIGPWGYGNNEIAATKDLIDYLTTGV